MRFRFIEAKRGVKAAASDEIVSSVAARNSLGSFRPQCASQNVLLTALGSQSKPQSAQTARIYVLCPDALSGSALAAVVKINGADVGSVANNKGGADRLRLARGE